MKKTMLFASAIACLVAAGPPAFAHEAHEAHEHGTARVNLGVEGRQVEIALETPLASLISFEHTPETDAQKKEARGMATIMRKADTLFIFPAEALCRLEKVELESEAIGDDLLSPSGTSAAAGARRGEGKAGSHDDKKKDGEGHADLEATISFTCRNPEKLNRITVEMFKAFPNLKEIEMQMITPKGQGAAELTPRSNVAEW
ncbi:MAG: DUF2796 domain-containing protein [Desulfovibrio sp.]|nr:DUF2796 domain-containing protein [Desulfovibrio sp.]